MLGITTVTSATERHVQSGCVETEPTIMFDSPRLRVIRGGSASIGLTISLPPEACGRAYDTEIDTSVTIDGVTTSISPSETGIAGGGSARFVLDVTASAETSATSIPLVIIVSDPFLETRLYRVPIVLDFADR
jgi:hypothetical protein